MFIMFHWSLLLFIYKLISFTTISFCDFDNSIIGSVFVWIIETRCHMINSAWTIIIRRFIINNLNLWIIGLQCNVGRVFIYWRVRIKVGLGSLCQWLDCTWNDSIEDTWFSCSIFWKFSSCLLRGRLHIL